MDRHGLAVDSTGGVEQKDPDGLAFVVTTGGPHEAFHVDDEAFTRWCPADPSDSGSDDDDAGCSVPDWSEFGAGATLSQLFAGARDHGVIAGDASIELNVYGDDDEETSGFFVVLNNRTGEQRPLGLTSGWHELLHLDDLPPRKRARAYLEEICTIANFMLARLQVQGVQGAQGPQGAQGVQPASVAEPNTVSITLPDGSCATWIVDGELSGKLAALIQESYGLPETRS